MPKRSNPPVVETKSAEKEGTAFAASFDPANLIAPLDLDMVLRAARQKCPKPRTKKFSEDEQTTWTAAFVDAFARRATAENGGVVRLRLASKGFRCWVQANGKWSVSFLDPGLAEHITADHASLYAAIADLQAHKFWPEGHLRRRSQEQQESEFDYAEA